MVQKSVQYVVSTSYDQAIRGFKKVKDAIGATNQKLKETQILGHGVNDVMARMNKISDAHRKTLGSVQDNYTKSLGRLHGQAKEGSKQFKTYDDVIKTFNKDLKSMSSVANISTRDIKTMTNQFNRFVSGVKAFESFGPSLVRGRLGGGQFTGQQWMAFRHQQAASNIPSSPSIPIEGTSAVQREMAEQQFSQLSSQMDLFGNNLSALNREALDIAKVFGDTTLSTSKFKEVIDAFAQPNLINVEKMTKGPNAGMYALKSATGSQIPGTPTFETEQEGSRFVSVVGNMRESMEKTIKSQETTNRRQGISFGNLLSLMVKFGIAMQLIELPGRVLQEYTRVIDQAVDFEHEIAKSATLIKDIREDELARDAFGTEVSEIAARSRVIDDQAAIATGRVVTEIASALETIPLSKPRMVQGRMIGAEAVTALDIVELGLLTSTAALEQDSPLPMVEALTKVASAYRLPADRLKAYSEQMIATIDIGNVKGAQVSRYQGELAGFTSTLWGTQDKDRLQEMNEKLLGMYAVSTITQPPEEAATGWRGIFKGIIDRPKEISRDIMALRDYTAKTPGMETIDLTLGAFRADPEQYMKDMYRQLGPNSQMVSGWVGSKQGQKELAFEIDRFGGDRIAAEENLRATKSAELLGALWPNVRALRTVLAVGADEGKRLALGLEKFANILDENKLLSNIGIMFGTAKSAAAEQAGYKTAADIRLVSTDILKAKREQSTREIMDLERYGTPGEQIVSRLRFADPRNWNRWPGRYEAYGDITKVRKTLEAGVPQEDLYEHLVGRGPRVGEMLGKYPGQNIPGLEPGPNTLQKFIQYHAKEFEKYDDRSFAGKFFDFSDIFSGDFIPFIGKTRRDEFDLIKDLEKAYGGGNIRNINSAALIDAYGQSSQGGGPVTIDVGGIKIELSGSDIETEEQAKIIADTILNLLNEINSTMELESYQNSDLSTLHRNVNISEEE